MKQRPRIYYTAIQKALMWDRWQKGESLQQIAGWLKQTYLGNENYQVSHETIYRSLFIQATLALMANLVCFILLYTHREDNLNMSSTWLCSRNDLFANVGVLVAASLSYIYISKWPDIVIGTAIAILFLKSSWSVIKEAINAIN